MNIIDIWIDVSKRIGFFTKENWNQIPEEPGIYAWFLPLWLYKEDLNELLEIVNEIFLYDAECKGIPQKTVEINYNWSSVNLNLKDEYRLIITQELQENWKQSMQNEELKEAIAQTLMEASIFLPPLYVGKTIDLKNRYLQHRDGTPNQKNVFRNRFIEHSQKCSIKVPLLVSDLLFVCIPTSLKTSKLVSQEKVNTLVEKVLLQLCKPMFSVK